MAFIYGLLKNNSSPGENNELHTISQGLKWPGAVEYAFHYENLSAGIILHPAFETDINRYLYIGNKEQTLVLLSGYFYNRQELLSLIKNENIKLPDPQLAGLLFQLLGKDFAKHINGDFTLVVFKPTAGKLFLYRDHVGIRPLAWTVRNNSFWFSPDGIGLCRTLYNNRRINPGYLQRFLVHGDIAKLNLLPDAKVFKLSPGSRLKVSADMKPATVKYWLPEKIKETKRMEFKTAVEEITDLLKDAVNVRSDVRFKAATHLSGGLDSGIVAALARQKYAHQVLFKGYSWSPPPDELPEVVSDERKRVDEIGTKCSIEPVFLKLDLQNLQEFYNNWKLPGKSIHETILRKKMCGENINLLFSGWGGDEFISINNRGIDSDLFFKLQWRTLFKKYSIYRSDRLLISVIRNVLLPAAGINFWLMGHADCRYMKKNRPFHRLRNSPLYKWRSRHDVHLALLNFCHLAERAEQWFLDGYCEGIEYRYPLLDKRIIEFMLTVPSSVMYKKGLNRLMLREVSRNILPDTVVGWKNKSNPAMFEEIKKLCQAMYTETIAELDEFKKNPDFDFVNFNALEKDISDNGNFLQEDEIPAHAVFILMLKHLNTFINEYYSSHK